MVKMPPELLTKAVTPGYACTAVHFLSGLVNRPVVLVTNSGIYAQVYLTPKQFAVEIILAVLMPPLSRCLELYIIAIAARKSQNDLKKEIPQQVETTA